MTIGLTVAGTTIPIAAQGVTRTRGDHVDRAEAIDGTYKASQAGGARRDWHFQTPPVTRALADTYEPILAGIAAVTCTGDVVSLPTMCCPEIMNWVPMVTAQGHSVVIDFVLHEVQPARKLLSYSPGDTITGETFTRSTTAYQIGAGGVLNSVAINAKRDAHYIGGVRNLLLEDTRTNNLLWSNDFNNAAWVKTTCTIATGLADPAGGTTACTLTASAGAAHCIQTLGAGSSAARTNSVWLKRRTGTGTVFLRDSPNTGFVDVGTGLAAAWTRFSISSTASTGRGLDIQITTNGDAVDAWCAQNEEGTFKSSEIPTTTVAITRGADTYSLPFTIPPQEISVYVKSIELGTLTSGARVFEIGSAGGGTPRFLAFGSTFYTAFHHNGAGSVSSAVAVAPVIGDTVELVPRLYGDGSDDIVQSINAAASTVSTQSAANALSTAWAGSLCYLNSIGTTGGGVGYTALQSFKVVAGMRSLAEMRLL